MISIGEFNKIAKLPEGSVIVSNDAKTKLTTADRDEHLAKREISQARQEDNIYIRSQLLTAIRSVLADRLDDPTDATAQNFFKQVEATLFGKIGKDGRFGVKVATSSLDARDVRQLINDLNEIKGDSNSLIPKEPGSDPTTLLGRFRSAFEQLPEALEERFAWYGELNEDFRNGFAEELKWVMEDLENKRLARPDTARRILVQPYDKRTLRRNNDLRREAVVLYRVTYGQIDSLVDYLADELAKAKGGDWGKWERVAKAVGAFIMDKVQTALGVEQTDETFKKKDDPREKVGELMDRYDGEVAKFKADLEAIEKKIKVKKKVSEGRRRELYERYCELAKALAKKKKCGDRDLTALFAEHKKGLLKELPKEKTLLKTLGLQREDVSIAEKFGMKSYKKELRAEHYYKRPVQAHEMFDMVLGGESEAELRFQSVWRNHYLSKDEIIGKKK